MKMTSVLMLLVLVPAVVSCGPSPEEIATMTALAWTPTPVPPTATPTATPVPFDLTLKVVDEEGVPIANALIDFSEYGSEGAFQTDDLGLYSWMDLSSSQASLNVSAQGYFPASQSEPLQRGLNEFTITLRRDPFGLLPSMACAPNESLLYIEDFQDNTAQGWDEIDLRVPGWNLEPSAESPGNIILAAEYVDGVGDGPISSRLNNNQFENAVWRTKFLISNPFASNQSSYSFNWKFALEPFDLNGQEIFDSRYQIPGDARNLSLRRLQQPVTNIGVGNTKGPKIGEWHLVETSSFEGVVSVWVDGKRLLEYTDPMPVPPGTIGLEFWLQGANATIYVDDMSVCELSAPFVSIFPVEE